MRASILVCCVVALASVVPTAVATAVMPIESVPHRDLARAERLGVESPGVLRLSSVDSDSDVGTVSIDCVEGFDGQMLDIRLDRNADADPGGVEFAAMDVLDVRYTKFYDPDRDLTVRDRVVVTTKDYSRIPDVGMRRFELILNLSVYWLGDSGDSRRIGGGRYQISTTCDPDPA